MASSLSFPSSSSSSSSAALSDTPVRIADHLTCSICMDVFQEPVTTPCGHSFCRRCLARSLQLNDLGCPLCKEHLRRTPGVNIILRDLLQELRRAQESKPAQWTGAPGEVACDVCTGRKLVARKSCLVCLTSYCESHLGPHSQAGRLKGHRLVAPVADLDGRACLAHGRPLELYNREEQRCVCALCLEEGQEVVSAETEWGRRKAELGEIKREMQQKLLERERKIEEIRVSLENCKDRLDRERRDIGAAFDAMTAAVLKARGDALRPLDERWLSAAREADELTRELQGEVGKLRGAVSKLDDIADLEDHVHFLQTFPSLSGLEDGRDWADVAVDTSLSFGTMRSIWPAMRAKVEQEVETLTAIELERILMFEVEVRLDPDSAHAQLVLSEDGRGVRDGGRRVLDLPDSPERFDRFTSVLGVNRLTSGRSYWEVEVGGKTGWDLGVAGEGANRKGELALSPANGYWAIVLHDGSRYVALGDPPTRLHPREKLRKVGVFVDYEEGLVSFYDVEAREHVYSFTGCSFAGRLKPYFSPHLKYDEKNAVPLTISPVKRR